MRRGNIHIKVCGQVIVIVLEVIRWLGSLMKMVLIRMKRKMNGCWMDMGIT